MRQGSLLIAALLLSLLAADAIPIPEDGPVRDKCGPEAGTVPQQVHVTSGSDPSTLIVTWVTHSKTPSVVMYGTARGQYLYNSVGESGKYTRGNYTSDHIHSAKLKDLEPATTYYYTLEACWPPAREFSVTTLPKVGAKQDLTFAVVGDLGQTPYSESTVMHVLADDSQQFTIIAGDLSYADGEQGRWDRWGTMFEPLFASRPMQPAVGNHEIEIKDKDRGTLEQVLSYTQTAGGYIPFQAYQARFPHDTDKGKGGEEVSKGGGLSRSLFYSYSTGPARFIHLCSYTDFADGSEQKAWLKEELASIDRAVTPWVFAVVHAPWYNSNIAHHDEPPLMRDSMEQMLCEAGVDVVFAGHVHAYERISQAHGGEAKAGGITYINVGDGGNREGLAVHYIEPQPDWSLVREASFGHGRVQIVNGMEATWTWHRIQDGELISADTVKIPHTDPKSCVPSKL